MGGMDCFSAALDGLGGQTKLTSVTLNYDTLIEQALNSGPDAQGSRVLMAKICGNSTTAQVAGHPQSCTSTEASIWDTAERP